MRENEMSSVDDPFTELEQEFAGAGTTTVLERDMKALGDDDGDHDRFSHYVRKETILESAVSGAPVIALCGKVWVPGRDPEKFPVCPECQKIYESLRGDDAD